MEPVTIALIAGGAMLLASGKKKPPKPPEYEPPQCPAGFLWSQADLSCVPVLTDDQPPQLHVIGDCDAVQVLPSVPTYFTGYVQPQLNSFLAGMNAQPQADDLGAAVGSDGTVVPAAEMATAILARSPIAFATDEFPTLGALCALPTAPLAMGEEGDPAIRPAIWGLYEMLLGPTIEAVEQFNRTGEATIQPPTGG